MAVSISTGAYRAMKLGEGFIEITPRIARGFERSLSSGLSHIGATLTKAITLPLAVAGGQAVKMSADYSLAMGRVQALTHATAQEVQQFTDILKRNAPRWGASPQELADTMFIVASAGEKGADAIAAVEAASKAAAAGMGEANTLFKAANSAISAYGRANIDTAKAMDILVQTGKESDDAVSNIVEAMLPAIPVAANLGIKFEEVGAAMAALTRTLEPAQAGTSLRQLFVTLLKPSMQARDTLAEVGLTAQGLRDTLESGGLLRVLQLLTERFGENEEASAVLFNNVRALTGFLALANMEGNELAGVFQRVANHTGALDEAFSIVSETAGFKLQRALDVMRATMIDIGDTLAPIAERFASAFARIFEIFSELPQDSQENLLKFIGSLALLGPAFLVAGKVVGAIRVLSAGLTHFGRALGLIRGVRDVIPALTVALGGLHPVALVAGGALTYLTLNSEEFRGAIGDLLVALAPVGDALGTLASVVGKTIGGALDFAGKMIGDLVGAFSMLPQPIQMSTLALGAFALALRFAGPVGIALTAIGAVVSVVQSFIPNTKEAAEATLEFSGNIDVLSKQIDSFVRGGGAPGRELTNILSDLAGHYREIRIEGKKVIRERDRLTGALTIEEYTPPTFRIEASGLEEFRRSLSKIRGETPEAVLQTQFFDNAVKRLNETTGDSVKILDEQLARLVQIGNLPGAERLLEQIVTMEQFEATARDLGVPVEVLAEYLFPTYAAALEEANRAIGITADATNFLGEEYAELVKRQQEANDIAEVTSKIYDNLTKTTANLMATTRDLEASWDTLQEVIEEHSGQLSVVNGRLDITEESNRKVEEALQRHIDKIRDAIDAYQRDDATVQDVIETYAAQHEKLMDVAEQVGMNTEEFEEYIEQLGFIPPEVFTNVVAQGLSAAVADAERLWALLFQIRTGVDPNVAKREFERSISGASFKPFASGGKVSGPGSGTSDSIIARLSNGEFVMNASATRFWGDAVLNAMNRKRMPKIFTPMWANAPQPGLFDATAPSSFAPVAPETSRETTIVVKTVCQECMRKVAKDEIHDHDEKLVHAFGV